MKYFFYIFLMVGCLPELNAQIFINVEFPNKAQTIKYGPGNMIHFKEKEFPDDWRKAEITGIDPETSVLFFKNDFVHLEDIIAVRKHNPWANYIGNGLFVFSSQWVLIGAIATIFLDYEPGFRDLVIPVASAGIGWSFKKIFSKETYVVGKTCRLRIVDLRMEVKK